MDQPEGIRVKFASIEDGITALGFRRVASVARRLNPATDIYFIPAGNLYSLKSLIFPETRPDFTKNVNLIADELAQTDLLCFSSMTECSTHVEQIVKAVKERNRNIFIVWGGVHCVLYPENAVQHVDAICTGEGEAAFRRFYEAFAAGKDYTNTPSMWFRTDAGLLKNSNRPLYNADEMISYPHLFYGLDCRLFDANIRAFRPFTKRDYVCYNGLSYRTLWTVGCPFSCAYCANDAFLSIDKNYSKIRYPSVDFILDEIEAAIRVYPFISTIVFHDDNMIGVPAETLNTFCEEYKKRVGLPFVVFGMHPNLITEEKVDMFARAGMIRARMGIQSGSEKTLAFYGRQTKIARIKDSARILGQAAKQYGMIPPAYDIITDNPVETREEVVATVELLDSLQRPYTLNVFSLRVYAKTKLWDFFATHPEVDLRTETASYFATKKSMANVLLFLLAIAKPPRWLFRWMLKQVKGTEEQQPSFPISHFLFRTIGIALRAFQHLRRLDFTTIVGSWVYWMWKLGIAGPRAKK